MPDSSVRLDWKTSGDDGFIGWSGGFAAELIVRRGDIPTVRWVWKVNVRTKFICVGQGEVGSEYAARRAAERAWARWLSNAGLKPNA